MLTAERLWAPSASWHCQLAWHCPSEPSAAAQGCSSALWCSPAPHCIITVSLHPPAPTFCAVGPTPASTAGTHRAVSHHQLRLWGSAEWARPQHQAEGIGTDVLPTHRCHPLHSPVDVAHGSSGMGAGWGHAVLPPIHVAHAVEVNAPTCQAVLVHAGARHHVLTPGCHHLLLCHLLCLLTPPPAVAPTTQPVSLGPSAHPSWCGDPRGRSTHPLAASVTTQSSAMATMSIPVGGPCHCRRTVLTIARHFPASREGDLVAVLMENSQCPEAAPLSAPAPLLHVIQGPQEVLFMT